MHDSVMEYVGQMVARYHLAEQSCLDVGSLDVNGTVRGFFRGEYVGVDMRAGPNVDQVVNAHDLLQHFGSNRFDVVVCCEMLEHDESFWVSMEQMGHVLQYGGHLILTTRGIGFPLHGYPSDYWRFTLEAGKRLAQLAWLTVLDCQDDPGAQGILLTARKYQ